MGIGQGKPRGKRRAERIRVRGARHTGNDRKREEGTIYRAPTGERLKKHRKRKDKKGTMYRAPTGKRLKKHRKRKDKKGTMYRAPTGERLKRHRKRKDKMGTMYRAPTGRWFRVLRRTRTGRSRTERGGRRRNRPRRAGRSCRRTS